MRSLSLSLFNGSVLLRGMVLAFMLFVMGINVADAAVCAPEISSSEISKMASDSETTNQSPIQDEQSKHGVCAHGHCHNGRVAAVRAAHDDVSAGLSNDSFYGEVDQLALSAHSSRLKRPPRA